MSERKKYFGCGCEVIDHFPDFCPFCLIEDLQDAKESIAELEAKLEAAEATLKRISEVEPIGDSGYKYGYAWERCVTIAVLALEGEAK